ncbi:MAG: hypothetical protein JWP91_2461 [Fibrobacteres bacterium]|nr:hypothetical protein [Fibrobacterota bacterium]
MLSRALREHGHEVMALGTRGSIGHPLDRESDPFLDPGSAGPYLRLLAESFSPDWILQVDDSTPLVHLGLETLPYRKAWYAVDSHLHADWHRHFAPLFDAVFCAQRNQVGALAAYRTLQSPVTWLPLSFGGEPEFLPWEGRQIDVSFVGTLDAALNPARTALFDSLRSGGRSIHAVQGDYQAVYRTSRAVINQSVHDDLNLRCFEAMGKGALLITDRITHSLEEIGIPGEDFLVYRPGDAADLETKIAWALAHPSEAGAMAKRGHDKVIREHRIRHRIARITEVLEKAGAGSAAAGHVLAHLAAAHDHVSRLSLPPPLPAYFAMEGRRLALASLDTEPEEPFALLALANLDFERGNWAESLAWLDRAGGRDGGEGYYRRYACLRTLALAHSGRIAEARQAAYAGLRALPDDPDLLGMIRVLGG